MAFKNHKGNNDWGAMMIKNAIEKYGLPLFIFYAALGIASAAIDALHSLDEKYDFIRQFGLDRI